jgi:hypothetical protein
MIRERASILRHTHIACLVELSHLHSAHAHFYYTLDSRGVGSGKTSELLQHLNSCREMETRFRNFFLVRIIATALQLTGGNRGIEKSFMNI